MRAREGDKGFKKREDDKNREVTNAPPREPDAQYAPIVSVR